MMLGFALSFKKHLKAPLDQKKALVAPVFKKRNHASPCIKLLFYLIILHSLQNFEHPIYTHNVRTLQASLMWRSTPDHN